MEADDSMDAASSTEAGGGGKKAYIYAVAGRNRGLTLGTCERMSIETGVWEWCPMLKVGFTLRHELRVLLLTGRLLAETTREPWSGCRQRGGLCSGWGRYELGGGKPIVV